MLIAFSVVTAITFFLVAAVYARNAVVRDEIETGRLINDVDLVSGASALVELAAANAQNEFADAHLAGGEVVYSSHWRNANGGTCLIKPRPNAQRGQTEGNYACWALRLEPEQTGDKLRSGTYTFTREATLLVRGSCYGSRLQGFPKEERVQHNPSRIPVIANDEEFKCAVSRDYSMIFERYSQPQAAFRSDTSLIGDAPAPLLSAIDAFDVGVRDASYWRLDLDEVNGVIATNDELAHICLPTESETQSHFIFVIKGKPVGVIDLEDDAAVDGAFKTPLFEDNDVTSTCEPVEDALDETSDAAFRDDALTFTPLNSPTVFKAAATRLINNPNAPIDLSSLPADAIVYATSNGTDAIEIVGCVNHSVAVFVEGDIAFIQDAAGDKTIGACSTASEGVVVLLAAVRNGAGDIEKGNLRVLGAPGVDTLLPHGVTLNNVLLAAAGAIYSPDYAKEVRETAGVFTPPTFLVNGAVLVDWRAPLGTSSFESVRGFVKKFSSPDVQSGMSGQLKRACREDSAKCFFSAVPPITLNGKTPLIWRRLH